MTTKAFMTCRYNHAALTVFVFIAVLSSLGAHNLTSPDEAAQWNQEIEAQIARKAVAISTQGTTITRGPYLQSASSTSIVIRWRTSQPTSSLVLFGTAENNLDQSQQNAAQVTDHEVKLSSLSPNTKYYYNIGSIETELLSRDSENHFTTYPEIGSSTPTRIWAIGDSGTADANAAAVRDAYLYYTTHNDEPESQIWLMLGDNAYNNGTDNEYQLAVFDMYPSLLRNTPLWPTLGNHDTYSGNLNPYFDIFTLPTAGESGGKPSGTENYYSFDYGNCHLICLDSQLSSRSSNSAMLTWLEQDLAATEQKWIIAYWHHPPFSKGSHNSDTEIELIEMRENALPILEAGGVDLVLCGHSHNYERSFFIDGYYNTPTSIEDGFILDQGNGHKLGDGAYPKPENEARAGAVYTVAGSSGKISNWQGRADDYENPTPHPVMFRSLKTLGSLIIDIEGDLLECKFLTSSGLIEDNFSISKGPNALAVAFLANSRPIENNWYDNDWFGLFNAENFPWVYHENHGWCYISGKSVSNLWLWDPDLGWWWTNASTYPFLYSAQYNSWLYYYDNQLSDQPRYFFRTSDGTWIIL